MSTPEENPASSRQRVSRACDLCRKKKVKCDGATPVCTNCKAIGLSCTFKDMTKKRGPPKGYIEAIENRLYKLENFLASLAKADDPQSKELLSELNSPLETPSGEQIKSRPIRRVPRAERNKVFFWQQDTAGKRKRESLLNQEESQSSREASVDEGIGQLSMDENGQVRYLGKSSGYYLLQNSKTYQNGAFHFGTYGNKPKKRKPTHVDPFELPPKDLSEHLIVLYFKHFYPFLPLFFKRQLYSIDPIAPLLLNAIYAIASRISPDARVRSDPAAPSTAGDVFFDRAERLLDESYDQPSISTVQALLLLSIHQHGAMKSARAWLYSGMAFRMAQDLGLHRNCDHWNIPPDECERRKRVFWCCFIVDRLSSTMYGRATTFEPKDCDVPFPSVDDTEPIPESNISILDTFIHLIRICDILGHVLKNIYYVRSLQNMTPKQVEQVLTTWNRKLHQWSSQLPESLGPNQHDLPTAVCQLHMIYHTTVILLHRPFLQSNQSLIQNPLPSSSVCVSAADSILSMASSLLAENRIKYVLNYAVYFVFTAGITFIKTASSSSKSLDYKGKVDKIMQVLDEIEFTWTTASKNCQILAEISGLPDVHHPSPIAHTFLPQTTISSSAGSSPKRQNTSNLRFPTLQLGLTHTMDTGDRPLYSSPTHDFGMSNFHSNNPSSTMDPFAAPGIIPNLSRQYYSEADPYIQDTRSNTNNTLINMEEYQENKGLIHNDPHVDVLSGVSEQATSLLDYVPPINDGRPSSSSSYNEITNGFYW